ncbi:hypothetical protein EV360DRAFT_72016 [Lentinula raphanica]|nr:hypothetical protein EV360DRAFT_72016 [Lentinula raphanica]
MPSSQSLRQAGCHTVIHGATAPTETTSQAGVIAAMVQYHTQSCAKTGEGTGTLVSLAELRAEFWTGWVLRRGFTPTDFDTLHPHNWLAWSCDAIDFFSVSLSVTNLANQFGRDNTSITQAISPSPSSSAPSAPSSFYPLVLNLLLVSVLELDCVGEPVETHGLASAVLQQGYAMGYLIAPVINLTLVPEQPHSLYRVECLHSL